MTRAFELSTHRDCMRSAAMPTSLKITRSPEARSLPVNPRNSGMSRRHATLTYLSDKLVERPMSASGP